MESLKFQISVRGQCPEEKYRLRSATISVIPNIFNFPVDHDHRSIGANHGLGDVLYPLAVPYFNPDLALCRGLKANSTPADACNEELKKFGD